MLNHDDCPRETPWGRADHIEKLAEGIWVVGTPSHGGIKLSRARNAKVPAPFRCAGGWYEEDCDWAIAALAHPEAFERDQDSARQTAINWRPEAYTALTGNPVATEDSFMLRERAFKAATRESFVVAGAYGDWADWVPEGFVGVLARRESDGAEQWAIVRAECYRARGAGSAYVLNDSDIRIKKPAGA
jgi:hypothetical protein